jgi:hypothetical protein
MKDPIAGVVAITSSSFFWALGAVHGMPIFSRKQEPGFQEMSLKVMKGAAS